jgi:hypothetical protein
MILLVLVIQEAYYFEVTMNSWEVGDRHDPKAERLITLLTVPMKRTSIVLLSILLHHLHET